MTEINISELTKKYNEIRQYLPFPTVSASESGIKSILELYPQLKELDEASLIEKIAIIIHNLAFE